LFERPQHTFVGHFIGSPGMNFLPAEAQDGALQVCGNALQLPPGRPLPDGPLKLGVRPEYVTLAQAGHAGAVPAQVAQIQDIGTYFMLTADVGGVPVKARLGAGSAIPARGDAVWLQLLGEHTCFYSNEELVL
jgi:glycerol transport system ATP-binding protein